MSKKLHTSASGVKYDIIRAVSSEIVACVNKPEMTSVRQESRYGDRLYGYCELVTRASSECFRSLHGSVYYFDGRKWVSFGKDDVLLEQSLNTALVALKVPKTDIINSRTRLISSAKSGALLSPLEVSPTVIGFSNGVWDFSDIDRPVRYSFSDRMPITCVLPYAYDPSATCPLWVSFLSKILRARDIEVLQKYLGLGCADRRLMSNKVEETLWLVGGGGNGKSTVFEMVKAVYGADNMSYMPLGHLVTTNVDLRMRNIGRIVGKIFNYCSEIQADDITRCSDTFKSLCSGEPQEIRRIGKDSETAYDIPFFVFNMNRKPVNRAMDSAFTRRLIVIDFSTIVSKLDMDRELVSKMMSELSGIRNWMIEGFRKLVRDGFVFTTDSVCTDAIREYEFENGQSVKLFCDDNGYRSGVYSGHWGEEPHYVVAGDLYQMYVAYCQMNSQEPVSMNMFGRDMRKLAFRTKRTSGSVVYMIYSDKPIQCELK